MSDVRGGGAGDRFNQNSHKGEMDQEDLDKLERFYQHYDRQLGALLVKES